MRRRKNERLSSDNVHTDVVELESPSIVRGLLQRQIANPVPGRVVPTFEAVAENRLLIKSHVESRCELPGIARSTFLMVFSPDGKKIASTHGNHSVYITDVKTGKNLNTLSGHPRTPWCIAFHPSSNQILATGCLGGQVRVWDLHGGSEVWMTRGETVIASLAFHPVDHVLVVATYNELYFWDWSKPTPFTKCHTANEKEKVRYVSFDESGHRLVTGISNTSPHVTQWDRGRPDDWNMSAGHAVEDDGRDRPLTSHFRTLIDHYEQLVERLPSSRPASTVDRGTDPMEVGPGTTAPAPSSYSSLSDATLQTGACQADADRLENVMLRGQGLRDTIINGRNIAGQTDDGRQEQPSHSAGMELDRALRSIQISDDGVGSAATHSREETPAVESNWKNDRFRSSEEQGESCVAMFGCASGSCREQRPVREALDWRWGDEHSDSDEVQAAEHSRSEVQSRVLNASGVNQSETELGAIRRCFAETLTVLEEIGQLRNQHACAGRHRRKFLLSLLESLQDSREQDEVKESRSGAEPSENISPITNGGTNSCETNRLPVEVSSDESASSDDHDCGHVSENLASVLMPVSSTSSEEEGPTIQFVQEELRGHFETLINRLGNALSVLTSDPAISSPIVDEDLFEIQMNLSRLRNLYVKSFSVRDSFRNGASCSRSVEGCRDSILHRIDRATNEISVFRSSKAVTKTNCPKVFNSSLYEKLKMFFKKNTADTNGPVQIDNSEVCVSTSRENIAPAKENACDGVRSEGGSSTNTRDVNVSRSSTEDECVREATCDFRNCVELPSVSTNICAAPESLCSSNDTFLKRIAQIAENESPVVDPVGSLGETMPSQMEGPTMCCSELGHSSEVMSSRHCANMMILQIHEKTEMLIKSLNVVRSAVVKLTCLCQQVPSCSASGSAKDVRRGETVSSGTVSASPRETEASLDASFVPSCSGSELHAQALAANENAGNLINKIWNWRSLNLTQCRNVTSSHEVEVQHARALFEFSLISFEVKSVANKIHELFLIYGEVFRTSMPSVWDKAVKASVSNAMSSFDELNSVSVRNPRCDASSSAGDCTTLLNVNMDDSAIEQEISKLNNKISAWVATRSEGNCQTGLCSMRSEARESTSGCVCACNGCPTVKNQAQTSKRKAGTQVKQSPSFVTKSREIISGRLHTASVEDVPGSCSKTLLPEQAGASPAGASHSGASPASASHSGASPASASHSGASPAGASHSGASPAGASHSGASHSGASHSGASPGASHSSASHADASHSGAFPAGASHSGAFPGGASHSSASHAGAYNSSASHAGASPAGASPGLTERVHAGEHSTQPAPERNHRGGWMYFPRRSGPEERFYVSPRSAFQPHIRRPQPVCDSSVDSLRNVEQSIDRLSRNLDDTLRLCRARLEVLELYQLQNMWETLRTHIRSLQETVCTLRENSHLGDEAAVLQHPRSSSAPAEASATCTATGERPAAGDRAGETEKHSGASDVDPGPGARQPPRSSVDVPPSSDACGLPGSNIIQHLCSMMLRINRRLSITRRHFSVGTRSLDSRRGTAPHHRSSCGSLRVQSYLFKVCSNRGNRTERSCGGSRSGTSQIHSPPSNTEQSRADHACSRRLCGGSQGVKRRAEDPASSLPPLPTPPATEQCALMDADGSSTQPLWTMVRHVESLVARHNEQQKRFQRELAGLHGTSASRQHGGAGADLYKLLQITLQITGILLNQLINSSRRVESVADSSVPGCGAQQETPWSAAPRHRTFMVPSVRVNDVPVSDAGPRSPPLRRMTRLGSPPLPLALRFQHLYGDASPYVRPRFLHPRYMSWSDPLSSDPDGPYLGPPVVRDLSSPQTHRIQVWDFSQFRIPDISKADENIVVSECKIHNDASVDISRDGSMLVALLPSDHYENVTNTLGIYSLLPGSRGQCLYTTNFEQNAVSVNFSPTCHHLLIGVAINRATLLSTDSNFLARVYRLNGARNGVKGRMSRVRNFERTREHAYMSVNCIRWLPVAGEGFVYGTNTGQLRILR